MTPRQALQLSVGAALSTIALKSGAWWATGSVGFLSDALESVVNLAGASFALAMVAYAQRPADLDHPSGHGKAEYFAAVFEGVLIVLAAVSIGLAAADRFRNPQPLQAFGLGASLSVLATIINLLMARVLLRVGREHHSLAAEADGRHLMADVWTTVAVLVGVGIAVSTGWYWLDPAVAILVAVNILYEGWRIVRRSIDGLMDAALSVEEIHGIESALRRLESDGVRFTNLRTRLAGARHFAYVDLQVPSDWNVERADALATKAERTVLEDGVTLMVRLKSRKMRIADPGRSGSG
ncbi:MAG: cation diffusion facilitator family transporter [Steroidobacteraceae bacterium]|jgi:cation diffusion facilitator family transporter|nr:cation diffusion facilitator family transporter [Steroidobacteraceae bacterium]